MLRAPAKQERKAMFGKIFFFLKHDSSHQRKQNSPAPSHILLYFSPSFIFELHMWGGGGKML